MFNKDPIPMHELSSGCTDCFPEPPMPWYEQEMNEELRAYARSYISPVKMHYPTMDAQMDVWGTTIQPEDLLE